jgi:hypothetical protein
MVYPKAKHLQLAQQLQRHFSCVLILLKALLVFYQILLGKHINAPSAINSSILSEYLTILAEAPLASKSIFA